MYALGHGHISRLARRLGEVSQVHLEALQPVPFDERLAGPVVP